MACSIFLLQRVKNVTNFIAVPGLCSGDCLYLADVCMESEWVSSVANHCKMLGWTWEANKQKIAFPFGGGNEIKAMICLYVWSSCSHFKKCTFWLKYRYLSSDVILKFELFFKNFWFKTFSYKQEQPEFVTFFMKINEVFPCCSVHIGKFCLLQGIDIPKETKRY